MLANSLGVEDSSFICIGGTRFQSQERITYIWFLKILYISIVATMDNFHK